MFAPVKRAHKTEVVNNFPDIIFLLSIQNAPTSMNKKTGKTQINILPLLQDHNFSYYHLDHVISAHK